MTATIYKIVEEGAWRDAMTRGVFSGSAADEQDGFIHFSTARQVEETAARHFAGQAGLLLVAVTADALGAALRWEPSRDGQLFPHLYGDLTIVAVLAAVALPLDADGLHVFPDLDRVPYTL